MIALRNDSKSDERPTSRVLLVGPASITSSIANVARRYALIEDTKDVLDVDVARQQLELVMLMRALVACGLMED